MKRRCDTCDFFDAGTPTDPQPTCRIERPKIIHVYGTDKGMSWIGAWPPVRGEQWCGEHKPRLAAVESPRMN